jgi:serpin B
MRLRSVFLLPFLLATLAAAEVPVNHPSSPNATARLARSANELGFDLYRRLRRKPGNLVMSPASLATALDMTWGGARGETAAQMGKVLHLEGTPGEVMNAAGALARELQDPQRPVVCRIANRLFAEKSYELVPAFVEKTREAYGAPVEAVDFRHAPDPARARINQWVEEKTQHRIQRLIPPGAVDDQTRLVLVNAIYFLGDWAAPFEHAATHPAPFHLTASEQKDVPTMSRTGSYRIGRREGVTALEIPYKGGQTSMTFLVPDQIDGLAALEESLDAKTLDAILGTMKEERVRVTLPKFKLDPAASLALREELERLGLRLAFDPEKADFTGIADPPRPADRLVLSNVFHKGFVRVDEKGTEAAAATAVMGLRAGAMMTAPPRLFQADRPFLFLLRDDASGLVLFLGRVADPSRP